MLVAARCRALPQLVPKLVTHNREYAMARTISAVYLCEESLLVWASCAKYRACPGRARWEQNNRGIARAAEYYLTVALGI